MRHKGSIAKWNDERGFGFISPSEEGSSVFVHISSFPRSDRRPGVNEAVSYTLAFDSHGRPQANDVRFIVGSHSASLMRQIPRSGIAVPIAFAISFLAALAALAAVGWLALHWLALYYVASIITYGIYAQDKTAAQNAGRRIPESTLHLMSLVGGWPGALIAQVVLRHKTRKPSFLIGYWFTVIVNCIALGVIVWKGVWPVKILLGAAV
ncbi:MAG: hypothetical protein QOH25_2092 [Acidobacteriota bacterium]|jgi:uncharacterized membrane protein YsdA (DUF1294 family)/cold shock CspA family protein|nr:hypothetical protein [Acidobacteriota bacterium]